jgi:hypothetical protein
MTARAHSQHELLADRLEIRRFDLATALANGRYADDAQTPDVR